MKLLPNGNYELTKDELFDLVSNSEELNVLHYDGVDEWEGYGESTGEYVNEKLSELGVECFDDDELEFKFETMVEEIIKKIQ